MTVAPDLRKRQPMLAELLDGFTEVAPASDRPVAGLAMDSSRLARGELFLACTGDRGHGLDWLDDALARGAAAVAWEPAAGRSAPSLPADVPGFAVPGLRSRVGVIAARYFGDPSRHMDVVAVTGTNGKTTVTHLVAQALNGAGRPCGLIGTLGYGMPDRLERGAHTTPDAVVMQRVLAGLLGQGARAVAIEVSSHALAQGRTSGVCFRVAAFTNLTRDHLDYHADIEDYAATKRRLFDAPGLAAAVVHADDAYGREIMRGLPADIVVTAVGIATAGRSRYVEIEDFELHARGMDVVLGTHAGRIAFNSSLLGRFNVSNLAIAAGILLELGLPPAEIARRFAAAATVPGRMEAFGGTAGQPLVVVDYAHTPDALEQVLRAARAHARGRLWCVFGCGGERDRGKRPLMAAVAAAWADQIVVTDDNPRNEDPDAIVADTVAGFPAAARWQVQRDRGLAIAGAVGGASAGDVVVVAGKGHEDYQLVGTQIRPFSDRDTVSGMLTGRWT